jgi:hypothetical protein
VALSWAGLFRHGWVLGLLPDVQLVEPGDELRCVRHLLTVRRRLLVRLLLLVRLWLLVRILVVRLLLGNDRLFDDSFRQFPLASRQPASLLWLTSTTKINLKCRSRSVLTSVTHFALPSLDVRHDHPQARDEQLDSMVEHDLVHSQYRADERLRVVHPVPFRRFTVDL